LLKQDPGGKYKDITNLKNWNPLTLKCFENYLLAINVSKIKVVVPDLF